MSHGPLVVAPRMRPDAATARTYSTAAAAAATRLTPEAAAQLAAFSARSGVVFASSETLLRALTHKSYKDATPSAAGAAAALPAAATAADYEANEKNTLLGDRLLIFHLTQFVMRKYPALPAHAVESVVRAFCGDSALASVGRNLGVPEVMRWKKTLPSSASSARPPATADNAAAAAGATQAVSAVVVARVVQSLVGAIFREHGAPGVAAFIKGHILSREVDVVAHLRLNANPKGTLRAILAAQKKPPPVSRMLQETGRLSSNPVFIVGVYSGIEKIGQGFGSSIAMAETRACKNALETHYLRQVKDVDVGVDIDAGLSFFDAVADPLADVSASRVSANVAAKSSADSTPVVATRPPTPRVGSGRKRIVSQRKESAV
ncbi:hypothetical protein HDU83_004177 [Entophlyctis luteolus]|nr:hypothetical protein HDU83_004177 [Entophlyctis luteolus]